MTCPCSGQHHLWRLCYLWQELCQDVYPGQRPKDSRRSRDCQPAGAGQGQDDGGLMCPADFNQSWQEIYILATCHQSPVLLSSQSYSTKQFKQIRSKSSWMGKLMGGRYKWPWIFLWVFCRMTINSHFLGNSQPPPSKLLCYVMYGQPPPLPLFCIMLFKDHALHKPFTAFSM